MQTLMPRDSFMNLKSVRDELIAKGEEVAGIFVPWAGPRLIRDGGIYYVGIATDGPDGADDPQTFEQRYGATESVCNGERHERSNSPFWRFLDGLSSGLLGAPFHKTADRWGWSDLLKIGCCSGSPKNWPKLVKTAQAPACIESLRHEFSRLQQTLVFIASAEKLGILDESLPKEPQWDKSDKDAGIYWWWEQESSNLYVHGYHPNAAQFQGSFDEQLNKTVDLARRHLSWTSD
jgi:hypothetical protein